MIEKLISFGDSLESEALDSMVGKFFKTAKFEQWVSQVILYLETYQAHSSITEKAKEGFKKLNSNNNYDYYLFLLGSLKAIMEFEQDDKNQENEFIF